MDKWLTNSSQKVLLRVVAHCERSKASGGENGLNVPKSISGDTLLTLLLVGLLEYVNGMGGDSAPRQISRTNLPTSMGPTPFDSSDRALSESLYKAEKSRKLGF